MCCPWTILDTHVGFSLGSSKMDTPWNCMSRKYQLLIADRRLLPETSKVWNPSSLVWHEVKAKSEKSLQRNTWTIRYLISQICMALLRTNDGCKQCIYIYIHIIATQGFRTKCHCSKTGSASHSCRGNRTALSPWNATSSLVGIMFQTVTGKHRHGKILQSHWPREGFLATLVNIFQTRWKPELRVFKTCQNTSDFMKILAKWSCQAQTHSLSGRRFNIYQLSTVTD